MPNQYKKKPVDGIDPQAIEEVSRKRTYDTILNWMREKIVSVRTDVQANITTSDHCNVGHK